MRYSNGRALVTAGAALLVLATPLQGQAPASGPPMTPAEAEAYQMSLQMTFVCNPQRHLAMPAQATSTIERETGTLRGSASYLRSAEGTFLVLEGYDDNQAGHCLVFAWFGGELGSGSYPVRRLSMTAMEEEVGAETPSFFTFSAVRAPDESATLVTEGGSVRLEALDGGTVSGSFELRGFTISSQARVDGVRLQGTFTAIERDM